ncbi:MAG TPA: MmgE/PrpD family protein [Burkholderiaceae bacterium]|nr:MmgE/PrpD family protein [Burkholderiaceae bacterium]
MQTTDSVQPLTSILAEFTSALTFDQIPSTVVSDIKLHVLDGIGVAIYGSQLPWTRIVAETMVEQGGEASATIWGTGLRATPSQAALVNATAGHSFEMDDIHKESVLHPNSLSVPVALALAESRPSISGKDVLTALIAGTELGARVGNAATTALFLNGFHPQGTTGTFVAAGTAGRLLNLGPQAMQHAIGIAGSMAAGLMAAQEGAMVKRFHAGRAAESGLLAVSLASKGFTGIENILEAAYGGFLSAYGRTYKLDRLLDGLGSDWESAKVGYKMYPNVTSIHTALDALKQLMDQHQLAAGDIERIDVGCGHMTYVHTAWPYAPSGVTAAQMNLFYGLAVMAIRGDVTPSDYAEGAIADANVLAFIPRIRPYEDKEIENKGAAARHAVKMKVITKSGQELTHDIWSRRGSPECPVSDKEVRKKFVANTQHVLTENAQNRIAELVLNMDDMQFLSELTGLLGMKKNQTK